MTKPTAVADHHFLVVDSPTGTKPVYRRYGFAVKRGHREHGKRHYVYALLTLLIIAEPEAMMPVRHNAEYDPLQGWEVDEILRHRGSTIKTRKYQVKWTGSADPTWEPLENFLPGNKSLFRAYHSENGLPEYKCLG
jgi:hypothetical protein